jgi:hypothetical protein
VKDQLNISDKTKLNIPIANLLIVGLLFQQFWLHGNLTNRITTLETQDQLMSRPFKESRTDT